MTTRSTDDLLMVLNAEAVQSGALPLTPGITARFGQSEAAWNQFANDWRRFLMPEIARTLLVPGLEQVVLRESVILSYMSSRTIFSVVGAQDALLYGLMVGLSGTDVMNRLRDAASTDGSGGYRGPREETARLKATYLAHQKVRYPMFEYLADVEAENVLAQPILPGSSARLVPTTENLETVVNPFYVRYHRSYAVQN
jgi:hypothetical protein